MGSNIGLEYPESQCHMRLLELGVENSDFEKYGWNILNNFHNHNMESTLPCKCTLICPRSIFCNPANKVDLEEDFLNVTRQLLYFKIPEGLWK